MKTEPLPAEINAETQRTQRCAESEAVHFLCVALRPLRLCVKAAFLIHLCALISVTSAFAATNDLSSALQRGLFEEEANQNLDAAIKAYQSLVGEFDKDRKIAATAVFRLGEVYRKLGRTNDAVAQYERIVQEFSDQTTLVTLSRQNLTGLGRMAQASTSDSVNGGATLDKLQSQYVLLKAQLEEARKESNLVFVAEIFSDAKELVEKVRMAASMIVPLQSSLRAAQASGVEGDIQGAERNLKQMEQRVEALRQQILDYEELRLKVLQSAIEQARAGHPTQASVAEASPQSNDEEQEIRRIQSMIQNSPDLINTPRGKSTPLLDAAGRGQLRVATFLLDHGANVNLSAEGRSPLITATMLGNKAMAELLLSRGADVNETDNGGRTPLHYAADAGYISVAETLLQHKADVNARDENQQTPLHLAAARGHSAIVKLLVANGADVNVNSSRGSTPLLYAATPGHRDTAAALLDAKADVNAADNDGTTSLHAAAEAGHLEVVKLLLERKADVNARNELKATPLLLSVNKQHTAVVQELLENGANPDLPGRIKQPSNVRWSEEYRFERPVYRAIVRKNFEILALLLDHGADPDGSEIPGTRPLFQAIQDNNVEAVELLLAHKADPNKPDSEGNPPLLKGIRNADIVRLLLDAGADANAKNKDGWPALLLAMNSDSPAILKLLLEHGADVNATTPYGWPALPSAVGYGKWEMVELLLAYKADVNARTPDGQTSLDITKVLSPPASNKVVAVLLQHGALGDLPDFTTIRVERQGLDRRYVVFRADTNSWNRFTLLETVGSFYALQSVALVNGQFKSAGDVTPFPDLKRLIIHRPSHTLGGKEQELAINVLNASGEVDCTKDVPLEFGDVVEIPVREYALDEKPIGLTEAQAAKMADCLKIQVRLVVRGQSHDLTLLPRTVNQQPFPIERRPYLPWLNEPLWLNDVLKRPEAKSLLLSSCDMSRVKVTRKDSATAKSKDIVVDETNAAPPQDLWLRDGDVIEVPEKP